MRILFVCTGNTCRSPMAEALAGQLLPDAQVRSAGLAAHEGEPASQGAQEALRERGLDLSQHRSRLVSRQQAQWADQVLAMTQSHAEQLRRRFPELADRVRTLRAGRDVADPFGGSLGDYRDCAREIERELADLASSASREVSG